MAGVHRWIFTSQELYNAPSREAGIDAEKELNYRQQCANLIQDMGQRLQVTQLCINTAIVYMHRFYMFHSFSAFHRNPMAEACLFLAAKVEEQPRKLEHVIKSYHICVNRDQGPLDVKSETYLEMAQELVCNENILLQTLGFDISVEHPHQNVVKTCTLVKASKDLAQTSYFLATNSLHLTTMCLKYRHTVVACVCIHLACKWSNYQIPCSSEGKHWFQYVDKDVTLPLLEELTQEFLNILDNCPSKLKKKILTWKSGQRPAEDPMAGGAAGPPVEKKPKLEPSATQSRPGDRHNRQSEGSGLRRVQTEPVLSHKDVTERKDRVKPTHPPPPGTHHREIPGYNKPTGNHPNKAPPGWSGSGRPTHPPPKPRGHPPPSGPQGSHPPQSSVGGHPPPSGAPGSHPRPSQQHQTTPEKPRSNIFEQMQMASEQGRSSDKTGPGQRPEIKPGYRPGEPGSHHRGPGEVPQVRTGGHKSTHPAGGHRPQEHGGQKAGENTGHSHSHKPSDPTRPDDSRPSHPGASKPQRPQMYSGQPMTASNTDLTKYQPATTNNKSSDQHKSLAAEPTLSTQEKIMQAHAAKLKKNEERMAAGVATAASKKSPAKAPDMMAQVKHEMDMQQKLQAELKKQQEMEKNKKLKLERERKERQQKVEQDGSAVKSPTELKSPPTSGKSPKLRSPPITGTGVLRQKSDSLSSKSDSDTNTPGRTPSKDERQKMFMDHQNKIQEDRKRLRRMSEELGDPKIEQKPVVMLDNVLVSPEKGHKPDMISPTGGMPTVKTEQTAAITPVLGNKTATSNTPTPSRTISLENYRQRKPLSQSQSRTSTPTPMETSSHQGQPDKLDKPTLAMEHLANIKLQGLKPLSEILKPVDIKTEDVKPDIKNIDTTLVKPESPRKHKHSKNSDSSSAKKSGSLSRKSSSSSLQVEQSVSVGIPTKDIPNMAPKHSVISSGGSNDSPGQLKKLKIKIGGVPMSPDVEQKKDKPASDSREHHKHREGKHEKKRHKHEHHRREKSSKHRPDHQTETSLDPAASGDLKLKLSLKSINKSGSDSPFKIDNPHKLPVAPGTTSTKTGSPLLPPQAHGPAEGNSAGSVPPMKLVLQKDKSGHYSSSGHKHKHSRHHDKPRKRSHSPGGGGGGGSNPSTPVVPMKIPRNDSTASLGFDVNGANSPAASADLEKTVQGVQKLIALQKKNIEKTIKTGVTTGSPMSKTQ